MASRTHRQSPRTSAAVRANGHAVQVRHRTKKNGAPASVHVTPVRARRARPTLVKHQNNQDKQQEIFSAALHLFQEKGYHGTSMQDLADAMGMQKASLYYYIRSKEELLVRVCERGTGAFTQELNEIVALNLGAGEKLRRAIECHLVALCEQLELFTVFLREQKFLGEAYKKQLRGEGKRHAELLAIILEEGVATGEFRKVNVTVTTLAILGMCNWLYEWYSPGGALQPREIARLYSELVLRGLVQEQKASKRGK